MYKNILSCLLSNIALALSGSLFLLFILKPKMEVCINIHSFFFLLFSPVHTSAKTHAVLRILPFNNGRHFLLYFCYLQFPNSLHFLGESLLDFMSRSVLSCILLGHIFDYNELKYILKYFLSQ